MNLRLFSLRRAAPLALAVVLGGCWESTTPLMPASVQDPSPIRGKYASVPSDPAKPASWYRADVQGKSVKLYSRLSKDGEPENWSFDRTMTFDAIAKDVYLVQSVPRDEKTINYLLMRVRDKGRELVVVTPSCNEAQARAYGATLRSNNCVFGKYDTVAKAARRAYATVEGGDAASVSYATDTYTQAK
ncbi:hypothetical protein [Novosphingobium sp.]|uniref:hypothetical protein n=1 Tax=Novosphingobium sp. TaxID=1874826 RepID=UPI0035B45776